MSNNGKKTEHEVENHKNFVDIDFVNLFDGTLEGWKMAGPGNFMIVRDISNDPVLATHGGMGLLWYSKKMFKDFVLKLDWKVSRKEDNSGIFLRFPDPENDPYIPIYHGYEIQINDAAAPDGKPIHLTGAVYKFVGPSKLNTRSIGEWNNLEIQVKGQRYIVTVNGEKVTEFVGNKLETGFIGLQNHDDNSRVHFKNIRIKEL